MTFICEKCGVKFIMKESLEEHTTIGCKRKIDGEGLYYAAEWTEDD